MIVMQYTKTRRLAGRIGAEGDLLDRLTDLCRTHTIGTAEIRGIGYLRSARLAVYDPATGAMVEDEEPGPPAQILSLLGNISHQGDTLSLHLQAQLLFRSEEGEETTRGGRLVAADVEDFEFFLTTIDDFGFVRYPTDEGISPWVQIASDAHKALDDMPNRSEFLPGRLGARGDENDDHELRPGDRLRHPRLGRCEVVQVPDEDRASVRLSSGRIVELHLGLLRLIPLDVSEDGHPAYRIEIRKRT